MEKKIIYDVGLHQGEDTEYYLARGYRVIAIEADPDLVSYCKTRYSRHVDSGDLTILHGAVTEDEHSGTVRFFKNMNVSVWGTVVKKWADRNAMLGADSVEIEVPVIRFKTLFSTYGCPYYLKIDIEGMDLICLKKLLDSECRPRYISIESEKVNFQSLLEGFEVFHQLGYTKFFIKQQANIHLDSVPAHSQEGQYVDHQFPSGSTGLFGSDLGTGWMTESEAIKRYRRIFQEYRFFGDHSVLRRMPFGTAILQELSKAAGRPLPGWYDTHASLA